MNLVNHTALAAGYTTALDKTGREWLVVVARGTYGFPHEPHLSPELLDEQIPLVMTDVFIGLVGADLRHGLRAIEAALRCAAQWQLLRARRKAGDTRRRQSARRRARQGFPSRRFPRLREGRRLRLDQLQDSWRSVELQTRRTALSDETRDELEGFQDAEDIPPVLSMMLEERPGPIADAPDHSRKVEYATPVLSRYELLRERFGTDDVFVFRGERVDMRRLARLVLSDLSEGRFEPYMRRRFEASTGIDRRRFYDDGALQPLVAASIVEEFLESPEADPYPKGVRYFFGHRIEPA